jgi:uncharacterized protein (TIGR03382 family)
MRLLVATTLAVTAATATGTSTARAAPPVVVSVSGEVIAAASKWTDDGSRIVTDATIRTAGGDVVVRQLGGTVDHVGMVTMPGPPVLHVGMIADVDAHTDVDLAGRSYVVVDDVLVTFDPQSAASGPFVRTGPTASGHYLYWLSGCIFITPDSGGTTELPSPGPFPIISAAIDTWNTDTETQTCSYMKTVENTPEALEVNGQDHINTIKFRDTTWCRPAVGDDPMQCYSTWAAGITTATYIDDSSSSQDGEITDADVEINGVNFAISVDGATLGSASCLAELQNTLTHELGHVHGLAHTCLVPGDPARVDNNGNAVPECTATTDPAIINATMYPYQDCGETKKEMLSSDDIDAICTIYPTAKSPDTCEPVTSTGGCCSAQGDPAGALVLAAMAGLVLVLRRRQSANSRTCA